MKPLAFIATSAPLIASVAAQDASAQACKSCTTQEVFQAIEELCRQGKTPVTVRAPFNAEKLSNNVYAAGVITEGPYRSPIPSDSIRASGGLSELLLEGETIPAGSLPINGEGEERIIFTLQPDEKIYFDPEQRQIAEAKDISLTPVSERELEDGRRHVEYRLEDLHNTAPTSVASVGNQDPDRDIRSNIALVGITQYRNGFDKQATSSHELAVRTFLLRPEIRVDEELVDQLETDLKNARVRSDSLSTVNQDLSNVNEELYSDNQSLAARIMKMREDCDCEPETGTQGGESGPTEPDTSRTQGQWRLGLGYSPRFADGNIFQWTGADEVRFDETGTAVLGGIVSLENLAANRYINLAIAAAQGEYEQAGLEADWTNYAGNVTLVRGNGFAIGLNAGFDRNQLNVDGEVEAQTNTYSQRFATLGAGYHNENVTALIGAGALRDEIDLEHGTGQMLAELGLGGLLRIETPEGFRLNASGIYVPNMEDATTELDTWRMNLGIGYQGAAGGIELGAQMASFDRHFQEAPDNSIEYRHPNNFDQDVTFIRPYLKLNVTLGGSDADKQE